MTVLDVLYSPTTMTISWWPPSNREQERTKIVSFCRTAGEQVTPVRFVTRGTAPPNLIYISHSSNISHLLDMGRSFVDLKFITKSFLSHYEITSWNPVRMFTDHLRPTFKSPSKPNLRCTSAAFTILYSQQRFITRVHHSFFLEVENVRSNWLRMPTYWLSGDGGARIAQRRKILTAASVSGQTSKLLKAKIISSFTVLYMKTLKKNFECSIATSTPEITNDIL